MTQPASFKFDAFISFSGEDRLAARSIAERLRNDGLRVWFDEWQIPLGADIASKIEEGLEHSRVLILCTSRHTGYSDWEKFVNNTVRFRDPLNKERRLVTLKLDDRPTQLPFAHSSQIIWLPTGQDEAYQKLLDACSQKASAIEAARSINPVNIRRLNLDSKRSLACAFSRDGQHLLSGHPDHSVRLLNRETDQCLQTFEGHTANVNAVRWNHSENFALSCSDDRSIRLWNVRTGKCLQTLQGHESDVLCAEFSRDGRYILSGSEDATARLWDSRTGKCLHVFRRIAGREQHNRVLAVSFGAHQVLISNFDTNAIEVWGLNPTRYEFALERHANWIRCVSLNSDGSRALSGSMDRCVRLWDMETQQCLRVLEGHTDEIFSVTWSANEQYALSTSDDKTLRLWDLETGECAAVLTGHSGGVISASWSADQAQIFSADWYGEIGTWNLAGVAGYDVGSGSRRRKEPSRDQVQYTNAKVLLVGDTSAGKTGLANRLATGRWKPSDGSTVGAWATQWNLRNFGGPRGVEREIWLWDFGGQADQRLIHQLYMDNTALILLLFNADIEDALPGLRDWQGALMRGGLAQTPVFLVAGRIDAGFKASRSKLQAYAKDHGYAYHETSALDGTGCTELHAAILSAIPWDKIPVTTTEQLFKRVKDEILTLRDEGQVLHTFKELRDLLWSRLPTDTRFTDDVLRTVLGHLDAPGAVKQLDYGSYILLAPEWINVYAQAVLRSLRSDENELGRLPIRSIAEGNLVYQSVTQEGEVLEVKRLPLQSERVVLVEMERQLLERGLCLRQGDKLVFPSHCGRDRPAVVDHPSIFVSYMVKGYLDEIYATLAVKLADSESFVLKELWRDAADFETLEGGHRMGIKLSRESADSGDINVYFGPGVTQEEQVIFANYIHAHLQRDNQIARRLRHYVCPKCYTSKGNSNVLMEKLIAKKKQADTECDKCGHRFPLWDALEKKFASADVRARLEGLQARDEVRLDARRKGKLLALEVSARITSADQKCFEIPGTEDEGLDVEVEFTDADGRGTGQRIYLQLKAGNSYLQKRKDGTEIFRIKKQAWVKYWLRQGRPVLLVIGTFHEDTDELQGGSKDRFSDIRWMEIGELLKAQSENGQKAVKQIIFQGERLDALSVRRWREKTLGIQ